MFISNLCFIFAFMKQDNYNLKVGDKVSLPLGEEGVIKSIRDILWGFKYVVRITKGNFNPINSLQDYKEGQLTIVN